MLFRAPTVLFTAWFAVSAMAAACGSGEYKNSRGQCKNCEDGTISPSNPPSTGAYDCTPCPAGQTSNRDNTQCQKCTAGNYNDTPGGTCRSCPDGYFTSVSGAKSCCECCAGYYSTSQGTSCQSCPTTGTNPKKYSYPGSDSSNDCVSSRNGRPDRVNSCSMNTDNQCPNPTGGGPIGSPVARKKRDMHCTRGLQACPRYAGRGGFECINTRSDPESCGGCRDLDGKGSGSDCTAMTGVSVTRCVKGSCVIDSCKKGFTKSLDGSSCVSSSSADGSNPEAFNAQEMGARMKRNSYAKRFARTL